jgi:hypothetical protein
MSLSYRIQYDPHLGHDERPYKLLFYHGGFDKKVAPIAEKVINSPSDHSFSINVPYPEGVQPGATKLPYDSALVVIAVSRYNSDDDPHMNFHGAQEAGSVIVPLKGLKTVNGKLVFHNATKMYSGVNFQKGSLAVSIDRQIPDSEFLPPTKFTVHHERKNLEDKSILVAAIIGQSRFGQKTQALYPEIEEVPCMPPWEFDKLVLPGFMLSCNKSLGEHDHDWWQRLIQMGVTRTNPYVSGNAAGKYLLENVNDTRSLAAIATAACAIPANYWRYGTDETQVAAKKYPCENYTLLSRAKLGKVTDVTKNGKPKENYITPVDDCENDGKDIEGLLTELQNLSVNSRTHPILAKVQTALKEYVVVQSLTGVHGEQQSDGNEEGSKLHVGLHSMTDLIHKKHFVAMHGRINKSRPLFDGWLSEHNPDEKIDTEKHIPINGEGTGLVDPLGDDQRNLMGAAYQKVMQVGEPVLSKLKTIMPSTPGKEDKYDNFYVSKVSMVVPHLVNSGYNRSMFTPVTIQPDGKIQRMVNEVDFMSCNENVALRVEPEIGLEQAQVIDHINSFYPSIPTFQPPEPMETSQVRQRLFHEMDRINTTFVATKRSADSGKKTAVADFYAAYYQITNKRVDAICKMVQENPFIVGVKVEEEPVARYLGGYRIAFEVDVSDATGK